MRQDRRLAWVLVLATAQLATVLVGVTGFAVMGTSAGTAPRAAASVPTPQQTTARFVASGQRSALTAIPPQPVTPLRRLIQADAFVVAPKPLPRATVAKVRAMNKVRTVEPLDVARVSIGTSKAGMVGVDPSTFRAFTPKPTAQSDALWRNIAAGDVAVSFVMGNDGGVPLGAQLPVSARRSAVLRVGAYATMGIGDTDAVVSRSTGQALGLPSGNGLVISAPGGDMAKLRQALRRVLPEKTSITLMRPLPRLVDIPAGSRTYIHPARIAVALRAALSKLGRPYVWGAEGPNSFDCSGLVQWSYAKAGIRMPRVTHQQVQTGPLLAFDRAVPGDLLFWRYDPTAPGYVSHVAIYLGGGKMIVAPRRGDVVRIAQVRLGPNFVGAVRVDPRLAARI